MGERTFYLRETTGEPLSAFSENKISESELRKRLIHIAHIIHPGFAPPTPREECDIVDYLLHGDKKDEWEEWVDNCPLGEYDTQTARAKYLDWLRKMPRKQLPHGG